MSNVGNEWKAILITTKQGVNHATTIGYVFLLYVFILLRYCHSKKNLNKFVAFHNDWEAFDVLQTGLEYYMFCNF